MLPTARRLREFKHVSMTPHADRLNIVLDAGGFHPEIPLGSCLIPLSYNRLVSNFIQILPVSELILSSQEVIPHRSRSGEGKVPCTVSQRYRYNAKEYLLAAKEASQPYHRKLPLSMASSWLSRACQDEAMDNLLASLDKAEHRARGGSQLSRAYVSRSTQ